MGAFEFVVFGVSMLLPTPPPIPASPVPQRAWCAPSLVCCADEASRNQLQFGFDGVKAAHCPKKAKVAFLIVCCRDQPSIGWYRGAFTLSVGWRAKSVWGVREGTGAASV